MDLSITQKKILKLLAINCRFSNQDIAKATNVSPDTVSYQIKNLIGKQELGNFLVQFDYRMIGFDHFHYLVRVNNPKKINYEKLKSLPFITFINTCYGRYDFQCIIVSKSESNLKDHIKQIENTLNNEVRDFLLLKFSSQYKFTHSLPIYNVPVAIPKNKKKIVYKLNKEIFTISRDYTKIKLDNLDIQIIKQLIENPRIHFLEISEKLNKPHETIRYRISNLIGKKFIYSFGLAPDYLKLGYFTNFIFLKLTNLNESEFSSFLNKNPHVFYAAGLLGQYDGILYMLSETPEKFNSHFTNLKKFLGDSIIDLEVLHFDKILKNIQFPEEILAQQLKPPT